MNHFSENYFMPYIVSAPMHVLRNKKKTNQKTFEHSMFCFYIAVKTPEKRENTSLGLFNTYNGGYSIQEFNTSEDLVLKHLCPLNLCVSKAEDQMTKNCPKIKVFYRSQSYPLFSNLPAVALRSSQSRKRKKENPRSSRLSIN